MIKPILIFFGLFFGLVGLLFWAKMAPAQSQPSVIVLAPPNAASPAGLSA